MGQLVSFIVGAMFASFEYHLFPYFMMAYTSVFYRITAENPPEGANGTPPKPTTRGSLWNRRYFGEDVYGSHKTTKLDCVR